MACVPTRSVLVRHSGTRWPAQRIENVWILPGVPQLFERQFLEISSAWAGAPVAQVTLYLRSGEGAIAEVLRAAVERFTSVRLGSYPVLDGEEFRTRVTVESRTSESLEAAFYLMTYDQTPDSHVTKGGHFRLEASVRCMPGHTVKETPYAALVLSWVRGRSTVTAPCFTALSKGGR